MGINILPCFHKVWTCLNEKNTVYVSPFLLFASLLSRSIISVVLQIRQWYAVRWFSASFRTSLQAMQAKWWWVLSSTWAQNSTGAKHTGVMPQRHLTSEANIPEFCASPVMLHRKSKLKGMTLCAIHNQELSIYTISLVPLSFTSGSDRPTHLKLMRWYQCKISKCAKKAESCSGVNTLVVRSHFGSALHERAGERGENHASHYMKCFTHRTEDCNEEIKLLVSEVTQWALVLRSNNN